jgi:ribosomal protein S18 acetylase RimI-like enzyme
MTPDSDEIRIEHLAHGQLDALIDAQNDIFQDYIIPMKSSRQFFIDFLKSVGGDLKNVMVALDGDRIVGYVNPVVDDNQAWVGGIGMLPSHRSRGIGTRLMLATEEFCRAKGAREISLEVIEGNAKAERLYRRLGYQGTRKYITAEGKPTRFEGFGDMPEHASLDEVLDLHGRSYMDTCWQKRKPDAVTASAHAAECYRVDGGFVLVRSVETSGFIPFLGVVIEKRHRGIGTSLMKFALTRLWNLGAFKVAVYNVNDDVPTMQLLDMFDFKVTLKQIEMKKKL